MHRMLNAISALCTGMCRCRAGRRCATRRCTQPQTLSLSSVKWRMQVPQGATLRNLTVHSTAYSKPKPRA